MLRGSIRIPQGTAGLGASSPSRQCGAGTPQPGAIGPVVSPPCPCKELIGVTCAVGAVLDAVNQAWPGLLDAAALLSHLLCC